ncbi:MAG: 2,3-dihydroxyphenylpropionate 1,2-dioxygenase [Acidimicrobiaceae bacterium]|jgi:2,3-dihydroxyphenylpropionate 1,2-dioxygenase|nr:2,3-dihydroxyphenylpropionate 1,2-dioxygenase [Acidimicrobiaceae bacterium]
MTLAACCTSHSPLYGLHDPEAEVVAEVEAALDAARRFIAAYDPELVVLFGVDHLNGFLYDMMPQFCIGTRATAIGDYGTAMGDLSVPATAARQCAEAVVAQDLDVALSEEMSVDHGFAQPLAFFFGSLNAVPVVPIFINANAVPRSPVRRARALGRAVGNWAEVTGQRVLLLGSGGLSHDPPLPSMGGADAAVVDRLLHGVTPEGRRTREASTLAAAQQFARGEGPLQTLAPKFDRAFETLIAENRLSDVDGWTDEWLTRVGGRGGHEVRSWVATFGALEAAGPWSIESSYYRPIPEWIVGFGLMTGHPMRSRNT